MVYLDNASTTRIHPEVLEEMMLYLTDEFGNPGSIHAKGRAAKKAVTESKKKIKELLGMQPDDVIIFTGSATEANNLALMLMKKGSHDDLIIDPCSHHSVIAASHDRFLRSFKIDVNSSGELYGQSLDGLLRDVYSPCGASISVVNSELGTINDVYEISRICNKHGVILHADFTQAIGSVKVNLGELEGMYLASFSAHKIHGPKGIGMLCMSHETYQIVSERGALIKGGTIQEYGLRGGTENVASIVGFAKAVELAVKAQENNNMVLIKHAFYDRLKENAGNVEMRINGQPFNASKTLSLTVNGIDAETLVLMLDARGICISAGSACMSASQEPSHILKAVGMTDEESYCTVRVSFDPFSSSHLEYMESAKIIGETIKDY